MRILSLSAIAAAIIGLTTFHVAAAPHVNFRLVNNSDRTIVDLRASNIDANDYGPNLLDRDVRSHKTTVVQPDNPGNYCRFDVRVEFDNGDVQEIPDVNLCRTRDLRTWGWSHNRFYHEVIYA